MLACQTPSVRCVNKTRLTLEMHSHDQLVRAHPGPRVHLRAVDQDDSVIVRIFHEVGDPHLWSAESWASYGSAPAMRHWLIYIDWGACGTADTARGTGWRNRDCLFRSGARPTRARFRRAGAHAGGRPRVDCLRT